MQNDRMSEIGSISDRIKQMENDIESREAAIRQIRKIRSKLVAKRFRLQKAEGLI
jgi:hypothetical protein